MAKAKYEQRGESLDFKNITTKKIQANDIVTFGGKLGIAGTDIDVNGVGSIHVMGVYIMPKKAGEALSMGEEVYFDGDAITATVGGALVGYVTLPAPATAADVHVKLIG